MVSIGLLQAQGLAVLEILPLSPPNNQTNPGGTVTLRVKVDNDATSSASLEIYISTDQTKSNEDVMVASQIVSFSGFFEMTFTFDQPDYACYPNGLYFIAHTDMPDPNEPQEQKHLLFDSATEDLEFRHTWVENGGIFPCQTPINSVFAAQVGGWIRNDNGCEATEANAQIYIFIRNLATNRITQLPVITSGSHIPSIPAGGKRYFRFSVGVTILQTPGFYEMSFVAKNVTRGRELDIISNHACKPFAFLWNPWPCEDGIANPNTGTTSTARLFTVGPNPTRDNLTVNYSPQEGTAANVSLVDMNGRTITTTAISSKDQTGQFQFDLSNQVNGIYFVRLQFDNGEPVQIKRIIKQ